MSLEKPISDWIWRNQKKIFRLFNLYVKAGVNEEKIAAVTILICLVGSSRLQTVKSEGDTPSIDWIISMGRLRIRSSLCFLINSSRFNSSITVSLIAAGTTPALNHSLTDCWLATLFHRSLGYVIHNCQREREKEKWDALRLEVTNWLKSTGVNRSVYLPAALLRVPSASFSLITTLLDLPIHRYH